MLLLIYTTFPDEVAALTICQSLLDAQLIGCANIFPIQSQYVWEGKVTQEREWAAFLKTHPDREALVETALLSVHPYTTPCIMRFDAVANPDYERWIKNSVQLDRPKGFA